MVCSPVNFIPTNTNPNRMAEPSAYTMAKRRTDPMAEPSAYTIAEPSAYAMAKRRTDRMAEHRSVFIHLSNKWRHNGSQHPMC